MSRDRRLHIGLTGGIGSGKSTVAAVFADLGARIVDTDAIARGLTQPGGAAIEAIALQFGAGFIDSTGALDRARMRGLAFGDPHARQRLEAILHPLIRSESRRQAEAAGDSVVVFDVPLLVESGRWREQLDKVLVVDCVEATQISRVMARSGWTLQAAQSVVAQQAQRAERRQCADAVIFNDDIAPPDLARTVHALWKHWCEGL
jgi:dephospho-CoA kinase